MHVEWGAGEDFQLNRTAQAWLGPGRPLGAGFDANGNLLVCDALKARAALVC